MTEPLDVNVQGTEIESQWVVGPVILEALWAFEDVFEVAFGVALWVPEDRGNSSVSQGLQP